MGRILVTPRSLTRGGDPALALLEKAGHEVVFCTPGKAPGEAELLRLLPGCVGWLAGVETITDEVLRAAGDLKVISRNGTGVDSIDLAACGRRGIAVLRAEGANARGVAELAMGLIIALVRSIPFGDARMKAGGWERRMGVELEGKALGLIGCGRIGRLVAGFGLAFGMTVSAHDARPDPSFTPSPGFRFAPRDDVLGSSDVVSLHCPYSPGEKPLVDREALARMRKGSFLVNTARAGLVDEAAVLEALEEGRIGGFATDVFEKEPPLPGRLYSHERVILAPHVGGYTEESVARATRAAVDNLLAALASRG
jgi:phosphoglycerate dehydrogenase-like enzyme